MKTGSRAMCYVLGAVDWILSPFMPEILQAKIKVFVDLYYLVSLTRLQAAEVKSLLEAEKRASAEQIKRLEQELKSMAEFSPPTPVRKGEAAPQLLLNEANRDVFAKLVDEYIDLLEHAVKRQIYRVEYDISGSLRAMAEKMVLLQAGPNDVVNVHVKAINNCLTSSQKAKEAYIEEGRLLVLELMGYLAKCYQERVANTAHHEE